MKKIILLSLFIMFGLLAFSQDTLQKTSAVITNSRLMYRMLEPNMNLQKVQILLEERKNGQLQNGQLVIGASLISLLDYQKSNRDSKFAYLMRHPTSRNQIGKEVSEAVIHSFQLGLTGAINNWLALHAEILYDPAQSFGEGTITSLGRNQIQLIKGFVLIGDLNRFPVYGALGKMDAPFGQTGSVSPFTNTTMWHAFGGLGYGAQVGFSKWNLNATFMAVQGGAQFRALHTPVADSTSVPSLINNFTADLNYTIPISNQIRFKLGGSYMHGSAYCQDFPVTHFADCDECNPAFAGYARLDIAQRFILKGSYAQTLEVWKGTYNPSPPLDIYEAVKVSSMDIGASYLLNSKGEIKYTLSAEFSDLIAGASGSPWERQNQTVIGASALIKESSKIFVEYFYTQGYVPLNFISGSHPNAPYPAGYTPCEQGVRTFGFVAGFQLTL
ncbi:MAG: hypothetical protein EOM83_08335 [Clostridia bacterium]|nr:hypothetical protein [Clostridia bacterium]